MAAPTPINSHINLVNMALTQLGHDPIADFEDASNPKAADVVRATYWNLIRDVMSSVPWKFATSFTKFFNATLPDEAYGIWAHAYTVPVDILRVWSVEGQTIRETSSWIQRERIIFTNLGGEAVPIKAEVIKYVDNVSLYDAPFREALAAKLAFEWSQPLNRIISETELRSGAADAKLSNAASIDGSIGTPRRVRVHASSTDRRRGKREFYGDGSPT